MVVQRQEKQRRKRPPWKRFAIFIIGAACIVVGVIVGILNIQVISQGQWPNILTLLILPAIGFVSFLIGYLFPFPPDGPEPPQLPLARELVRESASFRMGDTAAANFDYITAPIKGAYDTARQALHDASIGAGPKRGILILGIANAGKTRLAFEALTQTLPDWKVLLWNATYDTLSKVPVPTVSRGSGLVVFIDDLQEYVPAEGYDAAGLGLLSDTRIATLRAFLHIMQTAEHLVIVATCRLEDEMRVGARLRWLFDQLKVITLPRFRVEVTDPESATIIDLFRQHGAINVGDWDGTLGSLVLGLSKKQSQYEQLVHSRSPAVAVLCAMKLLSLAGMPVHTYSRIQGACRGVFGESTLQAGSKTWQESVDRLTRLEFVTEEKDQASGKYALVIRQDTYFDKVITDYPALNRPYQLEQHFEQLQKVLMRLHDSSALFSLGDALYGLKRYAEALAAFDQALRLDPNLVLAYLGKGFALLHLERYAEVLAAYEQALRLDPNLVLAYLGKGFVLGYLERYAEALAACEQAIRLDPNLAPAYYHKGNALHGLKRYEEALAAYDQALRLDPNNARTYYHKGTVLGDLKRYEEALAAYEQALRLDPNLALAYVVKGFVLGDLKRYEEALAAYDQALRLDPNDADAYKNKGVTLAGLKRYEEALAAYDQALRLDPNDAGAYYNKGIILLFLKGAEEALVAFDQAIRLGPNDAGATGEVQILQIIGEKLQQMLDEEPQQMLDEEPQRIDEELQQMLDEQQQQIDEELQQMLDEQLQQMLDEEPQQIDEEGEV